VKCFFFLIAGFETTSTGLSWFIHLISRNPQIQTKIKEELNQYSKQFLTIEQLDSLIYFDAVIKEVLRYSPPTNGTVRTLTIDDRLPKIGFHLYKGDQITISFYNLARDERYWKVDPNIFYPKRFLNEDQDRNHHSYAFISFGRGHRQCIGQDLVRLELKTIAARLMQYVTFGDGGSELNKGEHLQQFTIIPKHIAVKISFD